VEDDESISSLGFTGKMTDQKPTLKIDRNEFPKLMMLPETALLEDGTARVTTERTQLTIVRLILKRSKRK
jgi:hypothetical protein